MKEERVIVKVIPRRQGIETKERPPLKLRITYKGDRKYYATGHFATQEQWALINSSNKEKYQKIRHELNDIEKRALAVCEKIRPFSFEIFEKEFFVEPITAINLKIAFEAYIKELKANEQHGTAKSYQDSYNSLHTFKEDLKFTDITKDLLQEYEKWMLGRKKSISTVGIYLRPLRTIFNIAIDNGLARKEDYPFGKRKYIIPTGKNAKRALNIDQIKQIFNFQVEPGTSQDKSKDFWIFSYLCNGMNMSDIARLRWSNLSRETITFIREKTKRTKREAPVPITVIRNKHINGIINKWGVRCHTGQDGYVFDIIGELDGAEVARNKIQLFLHVVNEWMKDMGKELGFDLKLTTYVARHSFATILVRNGAPLALAKQTLGHASITTTEKYFAGFDLAAQEAYAKALVNF